MNFFSKIKEWVIPSLLLIFFFIIISYVVTKNENCKKGETIERLTNPQTVSTQNMSLEKVALLLPNLKIYLLSKYPSRHSLTSSWNNKFFFVKKAQVKRYHDSNILYIAMKYAI